MWNLLKRIHRDDKGAMSIETILIIAAIAIPILIFILKFGWPKIRDFFDQGMEDLGGSREDLIQGGYWYQSVIGPGLLVVLLSACSVTDLRWGRIPNWITYPGILAGFAGSLTKWLPEDYRFVVDAWGASMPDLWGALVGFALCGGLMVVCYALFAGQIGGGDVKLLAMIGSFLGPYGGLEALLWTLIFGAVFALIRIVWLVGLDRIVHKSLSYLAALLRARSWVRLDEEDREPLKTQLYLAPSAALGVLWVLFSPYAGM